MWKIYLSHVLSKIQGTISKLIFKKLPTPLDFVLKRTGKAAYFDR